MMTTSEKEVIADAQFWAKIRENLGRIAPLSEQAWADLATQFKVHQFAEDEHVFRAGDKVDEIYFVASGLIRHYYLDVQGRCFNKAFLVEGDVMSSTFSLFSEDPSPFGAQALMASTCVSIPYVDFITLAEVYEEFNALRISILEQLALAKECRERDFLLRSASERYLIFLEEYPQVVGYLNNHHIASYLGITEVALSRIRKRLGLSRSYSKACHKS